MVWQPQHVPTVPELVEQGLAKIVAVTTKNVPTHYRLTPEGDRLLGEIMRSNAEAYKKLTPKERAEDLRKRMIRNAQP